MTTSHSLLCYQKFVLPISVIQRFHLCATTLHLLVEQAVTSSKEPGQRLQEAISLVYQLQCFHFSDSSSSLCLHDVKCGLMSSGTLLHLPALLCTLHNIKRCKRSTVQSLAKGLSVEDKLHLNQSCLSCVKKSHSRWNVISRRTKRKAGMFDGIVVSTVSRNNTLHPVQTRWPLYL